LLRLAKRLLALRVGIDQRSYVSLAKETGELVPRPRRVTDEPRAEGDKATAGPTTGAMKILTAFRAVLLFSAPVKNMPRMARSLGIERHSQKISAESFASP